MDKESVGNDEGSYHSDAEAPPFDDDVLSTLVKEYNVRRLQYAQSRGAHVGAEHLVQACKAIATQHWHPEMESLILKAVIPVARELHLHLINEKMK